MTPRVDISRDACEQAAKTLGSVAEYALTPGQADKITNAADLILALRAALDAAEEGEARNHRFWKQAIDNYNTALTERDAASAEGYARGVRDAAKAAHAGWLDGCPHAKISYVILALLPADAKEKNDDL